MAFYKFPPKGYKAHEFPLHHSSTHYFALSLEIAAQRATCVPIVRHDEEVIGTPSTTAVNPKHTSFAESANIGVLHDSIVPRINWTFQASMTELARTTDDLQKIYFKYFPIYGAFSDTWTADDQRTSETIMTTLELQKINGTEEIEPLWNGTDLEYDAAGTPSSFAAGEFVNLTTDDKIEGITFVEDTLFANLNHYQNAGMLSKVIGPIKTGFVTQKSDFVMHSNNFAQPVIKRSNPFMFCGMIIYMPVGKGSIQPFTDGVVSDLAGGHVAFRTHVELDEWNMMFNQDSE